MNKGVSTYLKRFKYSKSISTRWSDMDVFNHINNAVYLTYLEEARSHYVQDILNWNWDENQFLLARVDINYIHPLFYLDDIRCFTRISKIGEKSFDIEYALVVYKKDKCTLCCKATTTQVCFDLNTQKTVLFPSDMKMQIKAYEPECVITNPPSNAH